MKILVVCQHYWPEPYYLDDVCEELVRRGHTVHVVVDVPNYPMGKIYEEYRHRKNREQVRGGVQITRTFTIGRKRGVLFRFLNYESYSLSSTRYIHTLPGDYDVVFTNQTSPVMMTRAATVYSRKWKKKCILYCMDLWPASLAAGGIRENHPVYRIFDHISKKLYNRADRILITSQSFRGYLTQKHGIPDEKIAWLPQYAATQYETTPALAEKKTVDILFVGNVGAAQSLGTLLQAASILKNRTPGTKKLQFHIVGEGSQLQTLIRQSRELELDNVFFHGRKTAEEMPFFYSLADALVVLLKAEAFLSMTLPGKVQTYMAAGKPILAAANGEIPRLISEAECGLCTSAEDAEGFAAIIRRFLSDPEREQMGINARRYYEEHFTRQRFMDALERELMTV